MSSPPPHIPVLAREVLEWLDPEPDGLYVDCTVGAGGHAALIAERLRGGRLVTLDRDPQALLAARERLRHFGNVDFVHANYRELSSVLQRLGIDAVNGVLIDAGCSSMQIDDPARGFAFQADGPLDMRMDPTQIETASSLLARLDERELVDLLRRNADVGPAQRIARAVIARRAQHRLQSTADLREAVCEALPFVSGVPNEVRQVFQAVRIAVNQELEGLNAGVVQALSALSVGGRLAVISFHSGEDRIVKDLFREASRRQIQTGPDGRVLSVREAWVRLLTRKPITPSAEEMERNSRAKSAKLRVTERLARKEESGL